MSDALCVTGVSVAQAYALASEIEWCSAAGRAADKPALRGFRPSAASEYDPLAATCLAELILTRLSKSNGAPSQ